MTRLRLRSGLLAAACSLIVTAAASAQRLDSSTAPIDSGGMPQMLLGNLNATLTDEIVLHGNETWVGVMVSPGAVVWTQVGGVPAGGRAALADINHDGVLDLIVATVTNTSWDDVTLNITVLLNSGNATFSPPITLSAQVAAPGVGQQLDIPDRLLVGDVNGDGMPDLVVSMSGTTGTAPALPAPGTPFQCGVFACTPDRFTFVWRSQAGTYPPNGTARLPLGGMVPIALADWNNDGLRDLIVHASGGGTAVATGDGTGQFAAPTPLPTPNDSIHPVIADVDADGHLDVVDATATGVRVSFGNGSGIGAAVNVPIAGMLSVTGLAAGDLYASGGNDVVVAGTNAGGRELWVARNQGGRAFQLQDFGPVPASSPADPALGIAMVNPTRAPVTLAQNGPGATEIVSAYGGPVGGGTPPPPALVVDAGPDFTVFTTGPTATFTLTGTIQNGGSNVISGWSDGTASIGIGTTATVTAGVGVHTYVFGASFNGGLTFVTDSVQVTVQLVQGGGQGTPGPPGPPGPPGAAGPQGPPGPAFDGMVLYLVKGTKPPAGFTFVGRARSALTPGWHFDVDVYVKGPLPPKHSDGDHDRDDKGKK